MYCNSKSMIGFLAGAGAPVPEIVIMAAVLLPSNQTPRASPQPAAAHGPSGLWSCWDSRGPPTCQTGNCPVWGAGVVSKFSWVTLYCQLCTNFTVFFCMPFYYIIVWLYFFLSLVEILSSLMHFKFCNNYYTNVVIQLDMKNDMNLSGHLLYFSSRGYPYRKCPLCSMVKPAAACSSSREVVSLARQTPALLLYLHHPRPARPYTPPPTAPPTVSVPPPAPLSPFPVYSLHLLVFPSLSLSAPHPCRAWAFHQALHTVLHFPTVPPSPVPSRLCPLHSNRAVPSLHYPTILCCLKLLSSMRLLPCLCQGDNPAMDEPESLVRPRCLS